MDKILRIACIGSREITADQEKLFQKIGGYIVGAGHYVSSGNADGSDSAFSYGANLVAPMRVIVYLPWKTYNTSYLHPQNKVLAKPKEEWYDLTAPFHPGWSYLKQGAKSLMGRNYGIIYKADKCIALLNHKKAGMGGTGQAWRIAESLNIPKLDLNNKSFEEVVEFLGF